MERFRPCFTAPTFETFCMLMAGFVACAGTRTVCGILSGAGLARVWPHDRAHAFFARRRWNAQQFGLLVARLVADLLIGEGEGALVAVDDTLFRRRGKKVWAASWFHDGSAPEAHATGYGNNWVIVAIVVRLPFMTRPVALPVLAGLVKKGTVSASRLEVARRLVTALAGSLPGRRIDVVGDAAYVGGVLKTRLRVSKTCRSTCCSTACLDRGRTPNPGNSIAVSAHRAGSCRDEPRIASLPATRGGRTDPVVGGAGGPETRRRAAPR
ncbi:transposase [Sphaerimonospora thailandensis]|uniref:transposase n=1 Tax=Sphaerimonospora thailandensis TaxID=795644 RepID=UPI0019502705|nr:transposase [Sphaerimonospora thailandensis]